MQEPAEGAPLGSRISELQRLRSIVDAINTDTSVVPKGSLRLDASGKVVSNDGFQGVPYPDKLESYIHGMVSLLASTDSHLALTQHSMALLLKSALSIGDLLVCMLCLNEADCRMVQKVSPWQRISRVHGRCSMTRSKVWPACAASSGQDTTFTSTALHVPGALCTAAMAARTMILCLCCS